MRRKRIARRCSRRDVAEALLVLAPAGSESYRRGKDEWDKINRLIPRAIRPVRSCMARVPPGTTASAVVIKGGGGCTNGLVAELLGQDSAFIQDYAERASIEMDLTAIASADRILLDVTPGQRNMAKNLPYATIQAQCDPKAPGVKGMSEAIFAYFLMTEQQRNSWLRDIPQPFRTSCRGYRWARQHPGRWGHLCRILPDQPRAGIHYAISGRRVTPSPIRILPPP